MQSGICIFLQNQYISILRSDILVKKVFFEKLTEDIWHNITIKKENNSLNIYINNILALSYLSHLPFSGNHIGLLYKDENFLIKNFTVYSNFYNIMISCLSVPDAFFSRKNFDKALIEYQEIASSFPGRTEGREAIFRAGLTLIEKAKISDKKQYLLKALDEFEKLHFTPSEPLEYFGKSLVYKIWNNSEEEAKCLELAIRKFKKT